MSPRVVPWVITYCAPRVLRPPTPLFLSSRPHVAAGPLYPPSASRGLGRPFLSSSLSGDTAAVESLSSSFSLSLRVLPAPPWADIQPAFRPHPDGNAPSHPATWWSRSRLNCRGDVRWGLLPSPHNVPHNPIQRARFLGSGL